MSKLIGYARVSTQEQELNLQLDALLKAGCKEHEIFTDKISGAKAERPGLEKCLQTLQPGDTLLVWRLDRLGRSVSHLISLVDDLKKKGIKFKSICENIIDTSTSSPMSELIFNLFAALAEFERNLIKERVMAGLNAARARGRKGGRIPVSSKDPRVIMAKKMHKDHGMEIDDICKTIKISRSTFYRYLGI